MDDQPIAIEADLTVRAQIQARAEHPTLASKTFVTQHERSWTYGQFRNESARMSHFMLSRLGSIDDNSPGHVAMLLDNHLELLSLYGGCAMGGLTLFGINTGLRGDTLAGVLNHSRSRVLVADERYRDEIEKVREKFETVAAENILYLPTAGKVEANQDLLACLESEGPAADSDTPLPDINVAPEDNLMIIYTSGTTGLPKGINNNHVKLCMTGMVVSATVGLGTGDTVYVSMPLFHSNSMFVGLMPAFWVGGSAGLRERFSGSNFVPDVFKYGATYWNYVGEPCHYVLAAIEKQHGGDEEAIRREVTENPANKLRWAVGNGASPPDIDRFMKWLGLEDMFELYGSTEAAISTFRRKVDPRGSVGEVTDPAVQIIGEDGRPKAGAELDADGKITNYDEAVGEICRVAEDTGLFQGYFDNKDANSSKYRDGVYHSGDLGHILERDGKRYLFFDGRTDDWIRKDGENFSALQVARLIGEHDDIQLAAAYGVPCVVSDELVMVALKMADGTGFDPQTFFDFCEEQIEHGGMDRKWMPDFIRVVDDFDYTGTQKVLVRHLKKANFNPVKVSDPLYWRERGDKSFRQFSPDDYSALRQSFEAAERAELLDR